jgi:negative regulator of genetic competence, sporulation and motility
VNDDNLPQIDISPDLKETIFSTKLRMKTIEYSIGFNELKTILDIYLQKNNFSQMEIRSIYHLINSYYFMGKEI